MRNFTPRRSDHPTDSAVHFVSGIYKNKRLVINIPPRCLKSVTVAVAYVAYLLGHSPHAKIIVASYGLDLARKHSEDCRKVMEARWYRQMFPDTRLAKKGNTSEEIRTTCVVSLPLTLHLRASQRQ
jgi:hypothetical protein